MRKLIAFSVILILFLASTIPVFSITTRANEEKGKVCEEESTLNIQSSVTQTIFPQNKSIDPSKAGTTDPEPGIHSFSQDTEITVTAIPEKNWRFTHWTGDVSDERSEEHEITISMDGDKNLTAHFSILKEDEYLGAEKERYEPGEDVIVEVKNDGSAAAFPLVKEFDIQIINAENEEVVHQHDNITIPTVPPEGRSEFMIWNQTDLDGEQVPAGNYMVRSRYDGFNHTAEFLISDVPPQLEISNLRVKPENPREGEDVDFMVDITNNGEKKMEYTIDISIKSPDRGSLDESKKVTIEPGETKTVSFELQNTERGEYSVEIQGAEYMVLSFEVDDTNFLIEYWWLVGIVAFVTLLVIVKENDD